mmetsp:Transcript_2899/g.9608  ORF Transcript_2899/g.9608 Transcript_2899/m.9608 type:complete len:523 (-) Transcript_2899:820-2388(-)
MREDRRVDDLESRIDLGADDDVVLEGNLVSEALAARRREERPEGVRPFLGVAHRRIRLAQPPLVLVVPVPLEALFIDEAEVTVAVDQPLHVFLSGEVVGMLRIKPDPERLGVGEVVFVELPGSDGVLVRPRVHLRPVVLHVHVETNAADDGQREDDSGHRQDEELSRHGQQVLRIVYPPERVILVVVHDGMVILFELLLELSQVDVLDVGILRVVARWRLHFGDEFDVLLRVAVMDVGGRLLLGDIIFDLGRFVAVFLFHHRGDFFPEAPSLVESQQRNEEGELHGEVDHDGDRAEATKGGDVGDARDRAREERDEVSDGCDGNGRPRGPQGVDDAPRRDLFDRFDGFYDTSGVVRQGGPRGVVPLLVGVEGLVDGAGDDEGVVEADAEDQEDADAGARAESEARREAQAEAGGRRHRDAEDRAKAEARAGLFAKATVPQREVGVGDDDDDGEEDEGAVVLGGPVVVPVKLLCQKLRFSGATKDDGKEGGNWASFLFDRQTDRQREDHDDAGVRSTCRGRRW